MLVLMSDIVNFLFLRLDLSDDSMKGRERYAAKEREEVIRKERERKAADIKAKQQVIKQIAEDRK